MTLRVALTQGTQLLERGAIAVPRLTAEVLLAHAVHCDRTYLYAHSDQDLREVEWIHYGRYLHERLQHKPTQYITHVQEFYGRPFYVDPAVLIPRPETEHLIEVVLPLLTKQSQFFDIGTGSGAIAITLALEKQNKDIAADISTPALAVARRNARQLNAPVTFVQSDLLSAFAGGTADLIVSNPPYVADSDRATLQPEVVEWEPSIALFSGPDGLDFYRRLIPEVARVLKPGGRLVVEIGAGQAASISALLGAEWEPAQLTPDLAGIPRVLHAQKK